MNLKAKPKIAQWLVVIRGDGGVDSVDGGAPITWLGHKLVDAADVMPEVREAAAKLVEAAPTSSVRRLRVRSHARKKIVDVEVLLVEGLPVRRSDTAINELVMRTLDVFVAQARSNEIDLTVKAANGIPTTAFIDGEKIAWALSTLVVNALRYARSHVGVAVTCDDAGDELVIEVSDDGPGMPPQLTRWLFDREPVTGQSAGLALVMVRDVMAAHRGSVDVKSEVARGTTFTLRVPR